MVFVLIRSCLDEWLVGTTVILASITFVKQILFLLLGETMFFSSFFSDLYNSHWPAFSNGQTWADIFSINNTWIMATPKANPTKLCFKRFPSPSLGVCGEQKINLHTITTYLINKKRKKLCVNKEKKFGRIGSSCQFQHLVMSSFMVNFLLPKKYKHHLK